MPRSTSSSRSGTRSSSRSSRLVRRRERRRWCSRSRWVLRCSCTRSRAGSPSRPWRSSPWPRPVGRDFASPAAWAAPSSRSRRRGRCSGSRYHRSSPSPPWPSASPWQGCSLAPRRRHAASRTPSKRRPEHAAGCSAWVWPWWLSSLGCSLVSAGRGAVDAVPGAIAGTLLDWWLLLLPFGWQSAPFVRSAGAWLVVGGGLVVAAALILAAIIVDRTQPGPFLQPLVYQTTKEVVYWGSTAAGARRCAGPRGSLATCRATRPRPSGPQHAVRRRRGG